jgi:hypothetical protein
MQTMQNIVMQIRPYLPDVPYRRLYSLRLPALCRCIFIYCMQAAAESDSYEVWVPQAHQF